MVSIFDEIPKDVLLMVISYLNPIDMSRFRATCKYTRCNYRDNAIIYRSFYIEEQLLQQNFEEFYLGQICIDGYIDMLQCIDLCKIHIEDVRFAFQKAIRYGHATICEWILNLFEPGNYFGNHDVSSMQRDSLVIAIHFRQMHVAKFCIPKINASKRKKLLLKENE